MYLIQFRLQFFFINIHFSYNKNGFLKPRDCKHGRSGEGARVGRRPPPPPPPPLEIKKKVFLATLGVFLLLFLHMGAFLLRFSHFWGHFHHVGSFMLLFTSWWGLFFGFAHPTKISGKPMIARRVREHSRRKFFV